MKLLKINHANFAIMGDIHGQWGKLAYVLEKLESISIFILGDIGIGFDNPFEEQESLDSINKICEKNDIDLYFGRGNHDRGSEFEFLRKEKRITFVPDYTYFDTPSGQKCIWIGGGHSIDRGQRVPGRDWWEGEPVVSRFDLVEHVDILLTHTSFGRLMGFPPDKGPPISWSKNDSLLLKDLREEQDLIYDIFLKCRPKKHFCGHFHKSVRIEHMGCEIRILDIFELLEIK